MILNKKITRIGIPTHLRVISGFGRSKLMIPSLIRQMTLEKDYEKLGLYKFEYEYIQLLTEIIKEVGEKKQIIFKVSPFENPEIYKNAFPNQKIFKGDNVGDFMKNVDVILNVYSSISVDALKYNIPVISISKFIKWDKAVIKNRNYGPNAIHGSAKLGIEPKNFKEFYNLLNRDKKYLINLCKKKNFFKKADELAETHDSIKLMTELFKKHSAKASPRPCNYFMYLKYLLVEIRQTFFRRPRAANYMRWKLSDNKLLYQFRIIKD